MNLYLIKADTHGYDVFDAAVVAAETEDDARNTHPNGPNGSAGTWVSPDRVTVELIGTAIPGTEAGVICASFNAG